MTESARKTNRSGAAVSGAPADQLQVLPLAALTDNYIWVLQCHGQAVVVDPGEAAPVLAHLAEHRLELAGILITHHHGDHQGGVAELQKALAGRSLPVFGPANESITGLSTALQGGETLMLPGIAQSCTVLATPGHTLGHLAFLVDDCLFCGDTLFAAGCGRLFEGSPAQMAASLARLAALPADTRVCCAHEYTAANLRFAAAVEPENAAIVARMTEVARLRAAGLPSLPSRLAEELATNPFLRCNVPAVAARAAQREASLDPHDPVAVFAAVRRWKDRF